MDWNPPITNHITFWTCSSEDLFPRSSAKMIYGTEKPKISSSNENNFWWAACPFFVVQIVQNFFTAGFDSGQPNRWQNIFQLDLHKCHDSLFKNDILSETGSQCILNWLWVQNYVQCHFLDLDVVYFKICPIFCLGSLGLCGCTVIQ